MEETRNEITTIRMQEFTQSDCKVFAMKLHESTVLVIAHLKLRVGRVTRREPLSKH